jgi:predicted Zn-dependent protease
MKLIDEELKAINVLYDALKQMPQSYALLHVQADFLRGKGKLEMALRLAKQAVNLAPSEFITWAKLTEVYIDLGDYESVCCPHLLVFQENAGILMAGRLILLTFSIGP